MRDLVPCPFCGGPAAWLSKDMAFGTGASGMEAPMRALGCANEKCAVRPRTKWRDTQEWKQYVGHFQVNYDDQAVTEWNNRA